MFKDFSSDFTESRTIPGGAAAQQAVDLIRRYPNLSEIELARLINLYRQLPALDVALMISDDDLSPRLDRFFSEHRSKIRTPFRQYAVLVVLAVVGIATIVWAVLAGS